MSMLMAVCMSDYSSAYVLQCLSTVRACHAWMSMWMPVCLSTCLSNVFYPGFLLVICLCISKPEWACQCLSASLHVSIMFCSLVCLSSVVHVTQDEYVNDYLYMSVYTSVWVLQRLLINCESESMLARMSILLAVCLPVYTSACVLQRLLVYCEIMSARMSMLMAVCMSVYSSGYVLQCLSTVTVTACEPDEHVNASLSVNMSVKCFLPGLSVSHLLVYQ